MATDRNYSVVYIAGRSYSGSTLLDLLISSHSRAAGVGELRMLSDRKRRSRTPASERPCTCGAETRPSCEFWRGVFDRTARSIGRGYDDLEVFDDRHNRAVLDAVHADSGARVVVDSSKSNDRLEQMLGDATLDVRPVHLIRDPRAQVYGHIKRGRSLADAAHGYRRETRKTRRLLRGRAHRVVHYERLAADPRRELTRIMRWLGLEFENAQLDWLTHTHHHIAGNRMRFERASTIRADDTWRSNLSLRQRCEIRLRVAGILRSGRATRRGNFEEYKARQPEATFGDYYVDRVSDTIERGEAHPSLGGNLRSGPFEDAGRDVFAFLKNEGLRPSDVCVDYGCGSLRIGQHLLAYLDPGNYWGLDVTDRFIELGRKLVGPETLARARRHLLVITPEVLERVAAAGVDVVLSNGVLPHVPPDELPTYVASIARLVGPSTRAYLGVRLAERIERVGDRSWVYPENHLRSALATAGLDSRIVPRGGDRGERNRVWLVAGRKESS